MFLQSSRLKVEALPRPGSISVLEGLGKFVEVISAGSKSDPLEERLLSLPSASPAVDAAVAAPAAAVRLTKGLFNKFIMGRGANIKGTSI